MNDVLPIKWGANDPRERGPVIPTFSNPHRNAIGAYGNAIQRAVAVARGRLPSNFQGDLTNTYPTFAFLRGDRWQDIGAMDPRGHMVTSDFPDLIAKGWGIQPTIGISRAYLELPEIKQAMEQGHLKPDNVILTQEGKVSVTKAYVEPVWHLPTVARRLGMEQEKLRETLFRETGMFRELVERPELEVYVPPIPGSTAYILGDPSKVGDRRTPHTVRIHDACHGSDAMGSDICTCRPFFIYALRKCIENCQAGGAGVLVYNHSTEGRAMGEAHKLAIYNARKRDAHGDRPDMYFEYARRVAGTTDMRIYELMPDVLMWLGVQEIDELVSESNLKYRAIVEQGGIHVNKRIEFPDEMMPADARVEMAAKRGSDLYVGDNGTGQSVTRGRVYEDHQDNGNGGNH